MFFFKIWCLQGQYVPRKFRSATAYIFLNDDFEGGGEVYPALGATVAAKAGRLVVQFNFDAQVCSGSMSRQEGSVVGAGTKHVFAITFDNTRDETLSYRPFSSRFVCREPTTTAHSYPP